MSAYGMSAERAELDRPAERSSDRAEASWSARRANGLPRCGRHSWTSHGEFTVGSSRYETRSCDNCTATRRVRVLTVKGAFLDVNEWFIFWRGEDELTRLVGVFVHEVQEPDYEELRFVLMQLMAEEMESCSWQAMAKGGRGAARLAPTPGSQDRAADPGAGELALPSETSNQQPALSADSRGNLAP